MLLNAYCTHRAPPDPAFPHALRNRRDRTDPEMSQHLRGFQGFVMQGGRREMTQTRYHVLQHIERVRHQFAMDVEPTHMDAFAAWAKAANAIVFLPDGSVRAPNGRVLVASDTGDPEANAEVPYPADARARKARTEERLAALGVPIARTLPPVPSEIEAELRPAADVALRCLGLFACAVRAESLAADEPIPANELLAKFPRAAASLSPKERAFMSSDAPPNQDVVNHAWRYEAVDVLRWALGALPSLPFPGEVCGVPALAEHLFGVKEEAFVGEAKLLEVGTILDELDLTYRLHWATTEARVRKTPPVRGVDPGVVMERHHALNWLTRFSDAQWDDVETPT
jgi:hypothetical protein